MADYTLDASRCALIVQDLQNDVIIDGGAFAESGSPQHAKDQNVVENVKDLAAACRAKGIPDGMKCDERGNIWVTGPKGVWVISPEGEHLGTVLVPENTGNHTWGGPDWHTLFIPSSSSVYTITTTVGPRREPYMR